MSKKTKLAIIISSVSVVVVAAIVSCILLLGGRSKKKAVDKFETAFNEENNDKLLKLMYPKECRDNADDMDELGSVVMYKIDKTWYILPGAIELIVDDRKNDDIENAESIKDTVNVCLANEDAYDSMEPYLDVVTTKILR